MKKKNIKYYIVTMIIAMLLCGATVFATEVTFTKAYVASNSWTHVATAVKSTKSSLATLYITKIYKGDGSASSYEKIQMQLGNTGYQSDQWGVYKGQSVDIPLNSAYQAKGTNLFFWAKGNNPKLDCRISGYFNAH